MVEYKFLCPRCKKLMDDFGESFNEINNYCVYLNEVGFEEYKYISTGDGEWVLTYCPEPGCGFDTEKYRAVDFIVKVDGNKIEPHGDYWRENEDRLKEIIKELNGE